MTFKRCFQIPYADSRSLVELISPIIIFIRSDASRKLFAKTYCMYKGFDDKGISNVEYLKNLWKSAAFSSILK